MPFIELKFLDKTLAYYKVACYTPVFDRVLTEKISQATKIEACEIFKNFTTARYAIYFFVCEQIFFILDMGTICLEVQKPNASCNASVNSVRV